VLISAITWRTVRTVKYRVAPEDRGTSLVAFLATLRAASLAVIPLLWFHAPLGAAELQRWTSGEPPNFILPDTGGAPIALDSGHGVVTIVHFFATWCVPCREELPALNRLSERSDGAINVLAISVAEPDARVQRFLQSMPLKFPVLLDRNRAITKSWNVSTLPTSVLLDSDFKVRLIVESEYAWDAIEPRNLAEYVSIVNRPLNKKLSSHN